MPQEAPADTAGPSSPPPQLPDGWLPQWEGVQRKWYFVQRATGKSQWEIPTEPVVLTPSTTPTSIGTGPTYPPSRPSTNSPQVMGSGTTLAEQIEPVVGGARVPSSLDAQPNEQHTHPTYGSSGTPDWHPNQTSQRLPHEFTQQFVCNDSQYGSQPHQKHGAGSSTFYPSHDHMQPNGEYQSLAGSSATMSWAGNATSSQVHAGGYTQQHPPGSHSGFALGSQYSQPPVNNIEATMAQSHLSNINAAPPPEPQWHPSQQPLVSTAPTESVSTGFGSTTSQPIYRSYPTPYTVGASPREFASRSSQSSNPSHSGSDFAFSRENSQSMHGSLPMHLPREIENIPTGAAQSMSRTHSQQASALLPQGNHAPGSVTQSPHGYQPQPPTSHGQYQATGMSRAQSGMAYDSAGYSAPEFQSGAPNYQNPLVQAGMHQYLPSPQRIHYKQAADSMVGPAQSSQIETPPGYQNQWEASTSTAVRSAASDPQFVSGPWASTPPTAGPPQPPRYE
ncbi:hypothetical protein N7509_008844 [Penicillium cosmopolitanum]|uniref:WW domain-containing protein n=1 Tax=Penicillium cosmopolitanum TaxID=1131564 RepID=A0A9W9VNA5_9EURO|nr:uncharacterized protein N7509_008844 [Penicillium cosmopolitanum]KAJ5386303.1 hypothetical protein N7509_008844 [Penicillium cosmopolitanum]